MTRAVAAWSRSSVLRALAAPTTPLVIGLGDRLGFGGVLRLTLGVRTGLLALAATVMITDGPALLAVILAAGSDALAAAYRPVQAAALPWLAHSPAELTAANVSSGMMESAGTLVGSAAAALILINGLVFGHGLAAAITVACALGAVAWRFKDNRPERRTFVVVGSGFVVGGLLNIAPIVGFAAATGYSSDPVVVLVEAAIASGFICAGIAGAAELDRRRMRRPPGQAVVGH